MVALENGHELRLWTERQVALRRPSIYRCATFSATALGLRWHGRLFRHGGHEVRVLCDTNQAREGLARSMGEAFPNNDVTIRVVPVRLGPAADDSGLCHPKMVMIGNSAAVVGSANLTRKALGIGQKPHNIEMSIGLKAASHLRRSHIWFVALINGGRKHCRYPP